MERRFDCGDLRIGACTFVQLISFERVAMAELTASNCDSGEVYWGEVQRGKRNSDESERSSERK